MWTGEIRTLNEYLLTILVDEPKKVMYSEHSSLQNLFCPGLFCDSVRADVQGLEPVDLVHGTNTQRRNRLHTYVETTNCQT
jgi:hypothetical protein